MRAGQFDREITVERKSVSPDPDYGTPVVTWVPLATEGSPPVAVRFMAEAQDVLPSRSETGNNGLLIAANRTRIRMRWRDDIDSSMRIVLHGDGDVVYQIIGGPAVVEGRQQMIELLCEKYSS